MKTLLTIALAMSMFLTGFAEPTNELAALSSVSLHDQKAKITLLEGIGRVKVYVKNTNGKTLYCTSYKVSEDVIMPFNLEELPAGKYVIRIQSKDAKIDYEVETKAKEVRNYGYKADVRNIKDQYVKVSVYEKFDEGAILVKIYDNKNRLLHKEIVKGGPFARKYTFENGHQGLYFSLTDEKGNNQIYYI